MRGANLDTDNAKIFATVYALYSGVAFLTFVAVLFARSCIASCTNSISICLGGMITHQSQARHARSKLRSSADAAYWLLFPQRLF